MQPINRIEFDQSELLRFITAGSVDDGKSTLIGRLLHDSKAIFEDQLLAVERTSQHRGVQGLDFSLLTDGLQAEREQGITIDVAYRHFATGLNFRDIICIPISALKGDMVVERGENLPWYEGPALLELLENIEIDYDLNLDDFRFPVQWVCRPATLENHDFRGYMGRIESGIVNVGDRVIVLPSSRSSTLKQILTFDGELNRAFAPQSVTLLLEDNIDISRGDMIVKSGDTVRVMK